MANYKPDFSCQSKFIPIDFSAQIIAGTFEYALSQIVDNHLDLSGFDCWFNNDKGGAAAYSPQVMLKIILFGYSRGYISSRRIANACETNITFMSLSGDVQPHYTSIASFVAQMKDQIEPLFTQIILQAQTWGSVGEQQTLKPAIEQLKKTLDELGTPGPLHKAKFTADSGFHSEVNLEYMATTGLDTYIADTQFRSRNPLFKESETYHTEKEKRRLKRSKAQ